MTEFSSSFRKEAEWEEVCNVCNGSRYVGVMQNGDGFDFIECEKCHGTGYIMTMQYGFSKDDNDE